MRKEPIYIIEHVTERDGNIERRGFRKPGRIRIAKYTAMAKKLGYPPGTIATTEQLAYLHSLCVANGVSYHNMGNSVRFYGVGPKMPPGYQWNRLGVREVPVSDRSEVVNVWRYEKDPYATGCKRDVLKCVRAAREALVRYPYEHYDYPTLRTMFNVEAMYAPVR